MSTITEKLDKLNNIKQNIKDAIIAKGQTVGDVFDTYAEAISKISGGGGDIPEILDTDPLTFVRVDNLGLDGGISIINNGVTNTKAFEYNKNDTGWTAYTVGDEISMVYGDKVQFRSNDTTAVSTHATEYRYFKTRGLYNCGGTLASLMNNSTTITLSNYSFTNLFQYCNIIKAPVLPFWSLGNYCYYFMFQYCTSLVTAPELPATTLKTHCYDHMFLNCTSLTTATELPATTLTSNCYTSMFLNCTSLVNAPELPAITLSTQCYQNMFQGCTSLITAPSKLPAITLSAQCYQNMFRDCTSLEVSPKIYAETIYDTYSMGGMFNGCTNLKEVYFMGRYTSGTTEITSSIGSSWLSSVPNTSDCILHKNPDWAGPTARGVNTIPTNWQIVDWIE